MAEIEAGKYDAVMDEVAKLYTDELRKRYVAREAGADGFEGVGTEGQDEPLAVLRKRRGESAAVCQGR